MKWQQCVIDFAIVLITIPSLVVVALLLEYMMNHTGWSEQLETQIIMVTLAVAFFLICIMISVYLTHRVGNCLWAGPQSDQQSIYSIERGHMGDYPHNATPPPTYETIMGDHEPPSYEKISKIFSPQEPPPSYAATIALDRDSTVHI
ncbi:uncharacterized protein LOC128708284 [Anopheles marshallii]|uniref:uncharacterized protein LOC128708284 n=1 Tax=Anopheles marshallii TaxID=1521116 RepID=UPI00237A3999|nr:uncharacterized protein LOC128708284 [Anopheles marshallii]